jgi:aspartyl-tRNA(Asn)/glutamyl-tRNA(Gln) amidotransferase subunit C
MKIAKDKVRYTADLARISLTPEEEALFSSQLEDILSYMGKIGEIDTVDAEPSSHAFPMGNVFRGDNLKRSLPIAEALMNAPDKEDGFFRVPRIIE